MLTNYNENQIEQFITNRQVEPYYQPIRENRSDTQFYTKFEVLARIEVDTPRSELKLLDYMEGNFSTLSVIENKKSKARTLYMNGFSTATVSDSIGGSDYMQAMGFIPMIVMNL